MGTALQLETVATPYGTITNVHVLSRWPGGAPQDCRLLAEDTVPTPHGWLTPHPDPEDVRWPGTETARSSAYSCARASSAATGQNRTSASWQASYPFLCTGRK